MIQLPKFCFECGAPVIRGEIRIYGYDSQTSDPKRSQRFKCSKIRWWMFKDFFHTDTFYDLTKSEYEETLTQGPA